MVNSYFDIDRSGYVYVLKVRTTKNKKGENVDTIIKVTHMGALHWSECAFLIDYEIWPRCLESGDYDNHFAKD